MSSVALETQSFQVVSPRLARGLGRDLFRHIEDRLDTHWPTLQARLRALQRSYRSPRDAKGVYDRCHSALRNCGFGFVGTAQDTFSASQGMVYLPSYRLWEDGEKEPLLRAMMVHLSVHGLETGAQTIHVGTIGHHAVQRMFERMGTVSKAEVLDELVSSSAEMSRLSSAALFAEMSAPVKQVPVPTASGILLCRYDNEHSLLHARTFLRRGGSRRLDASVDSIRKWSEARSNSSFAAIAMVPELLGLIENAWWKTPYEVEELKEAEAVNSG